jgi:hypothetical protein
VQYRVVVDFDREVVETGLHTITTGALPEGLPVPTLTQGDAEHWYAEGHYLFGSINQHPGGWVGGHYWSWIIDRQGRVVWARPTPNQNWTIFLRQSRDGSAFLIDEATYWSAWDGGANSQVLRMRIDGTLVETVATPGLHHAFTELPGGLLAWGAVYQGQNEKLVRHDAKGNIVDIWDCREWLATMGAVEFCQSNTLYWHEPTDTFLYSFYTNSSVVEIDHDSGDTLRVFGQINGAWDIDPAEAMMQWQHGVYYTDQGTLLLSTESMEAWETVVREYEVDDTTDTLVEIWNYGVGEGLSASTAGEAHRLPNGNTLHNYGSAGVVKEVTSDKTLVWRVDWQGDRMLGRTTYIEDLYDFAPSAQ